MLNKIWKIWLALGIFETLGLWSKASTNTHRSATFKLKLKLGSFIALKQVPSWKITLSLSHLWKWVKLIKVEVEYEYVCTLNVEKRQNTTYLSRHIVVDLDYASITRNQSWRNRKLLRQTFELIQTIWAKNWPRTHANIYHKTFCTIKVLINPLSRQRYNFQLLGL